MMDGILQSFSFYLSYVRLWEMQQQKRLPDIYKDIDKTLMEKEFEY
jgi:hypothetical protein